MRNDVGSNNNLLRVYGPASAGAGTTVSSAVDHGLYGSSVSFLVSVGTFATSLVATLQHSSTAATGYVDEADATMGNTVSATLSTANSSGQIDCPNPRSQHTRVKLVRGGTCIVHVAAIAGPKAQVLPPVGS